MFSKKCGNYMVCNIGAMDNLNHKMMQVSNVGSFLLCYDIVHKSILHTCLVVCFDHNSFDISVLDVCNVCYFLLCYDIIHK
jgi:hypothetical protein